MDVLFCILNRMEIKLPEIIEGKQELYPKYLVKFITNKQFLFPIFFPSWLPAHI